ncbi:MAG TPA: class I SAM-dependent methyltransferase [Pyrinomonadaceae bacterium]
MRNFATRLVRKLAARAGNSQFIDISDEYVNWVCFANAGMLHRGNLYCFDHAIRNLPSRAPIVEVGSFCGLSTNLLTYYKRKRGVSNQLITSDKWAFEGAQDGRTLGDSPIGHADYRAFVKETYTRNIRMFSRDDLPYTVEMLSDELFGAWRRSEEVSDILGRSVRLGGPISFCYIDGNHTYEFAKRDFENCDKFLESAGFVLFDDSADGSGWDVCKVVAEVQATGRYELVIKNPNYLFKKR